MTFLLIPIALCVVALVLLALPPASVMAEKLVVRRPQRGTIVVAVATSAIIGAALYQSHPSSIGDAQSALRTRHDARHADAAARAASAELRAD